MKKIKSMLALVLAAVMVLAMGTVSAFAASVEVNTDENDTHTYKVYQVYTGDLSGSTLSNLKYGANYAPSGKKTGDAVPKTESDAITDAAAFAKDLVQNQKLSGDPVATLNAGNGFKATGLADGYYLIVDETTGTLADGDALSANMVKVAGDVKVDLKKDTTSGDKKITSDTLGKTETTVNGKVDNVSIGDTVNFEITGNIPSHATDYDYYYFIIGDKLSDGLTFSGADSVVVKIGDTVLEKGKDYALYTGEDGYTFQVAMLDAKAHAGQTVTVTYSAKLNKDAVIGEDANTNKMEIVYSNNPNNKYDGTNDKDKPGKPDKEKNVPTGKTPEVTTETYTTALKIQKVDENGKVLTGAEFTITGDSTEIVLVSSEEFKKDASGEYYKLKDGTYTTEAPVTEDKMVEAAAGADKGYVEDVSYTGDDKKVVGGKTYRPYKADTDSGKTVYVLVENNVDLYDGTDKYAKTVTYTQKDTKGATEVTAKAEVGADGVVYFRGLGAGEYTITETKTPAGYNTIDPMTVNITFTAAPDQGKEHWSTNTTNVNYNKDTGTFELTIENQKGAELPSTGGIGTVIFYVLGSILVIGSAIVLISRRRMEDR